jgi:hypothetical protein
MVAGGSIRQGQAVWIEDAGCRVEELEKPTASGVRKRLYGRSLSEP